MPYVLIRGNLSSYSHKYPFRVLVSGLTSGINILSHCDLCVIALHFMRFVVVVVASLGLTFNLLYCCRVLGFFIFLRYICIVDYIRCSINAIMHEAPNDQSIYFAYIQYIDIRTFMHLGGSTRMAFFRSKFIFLLL